jgi:hypothetical protein
MTFEEITKCCQEAHRAMLNQILHSIIFKKNDTHTVYMTIYPVTFKPTGGVVSDQQMVDITRKKLPTFDATHEIMLRKVVDQQRLSKTTGPLKWYFSPEDGVLYLVADRGAISIHLKAPNVQAVQRVSPDITHSIN